MGVKMKINIDGLEMETDRDLVLKAVGEKWVVTYCMPDGKKNMGLCNSHLSLPDMIVGIRSSGGKNIVITDKTIFFVDDEE
jgi:hypothetical protein